MTSIFVEIPVSLAREDPQFPDRDTRNIYEHLKYVLSRSSLFPMPAIHVNLEKGRLLVTGGHKYLKIARELGRSQIRAILSSDSATKAELIGHLPDGVTVVPNEELDREVKMPLVRGYHVYFFDEPLSPEAQKLFLSAIVGFFERLDSPLLNETGKRVLHWDFPFDARCAEFEALFPLGDQSWFPAYLATAQDFSRNVARIASFQGARFHN